MDVNNIESRLRRVYISIGKIIIQDHAKDVSFSHNLGSNQGSTITDINFGPTDEDEQYLRIENVLSALGRLKEHLKNRMTALSLDKKLVEDEIDNNIALQLIADLDNTEKHGYPLRNSDRSKKSRC